MVDLPRMLPSRRLFARIDRMQCECPHCGRLIFAGLDKRFLPRRLTGSRARANAKDRPTAASVLKMFWNPHTQRLCCPWCERVFTLGILFYPVKPKSRRVLVPAPDVIPTPAEVAEMRRLAGGWFVRRVRQIEEQANLLVTAECSCPEQGTDPICAIHGDRVLGRADPGGESR